MCQSFQSCVICGSMNIEIVRLVARSVCLSMGVGSSKRGAGVELVSAFAESAKAPLS